MKINKYSFFSISAVLMLLLGSAIACKEASRREVSEMKIAEVADTSENTGEEPEIVARGAYLVGVIGCADCHTPKKMTEQGPVPDMEKYMMGFDSSRPLPPVPDNLPIGPWVLFSGELTAAVGPWGTSYAGNLTPHETGIGNWTYENFRRALVEGKYKGLENSRPLMPPMPVEAYRNLSDEDVQAIFTYLQSIKPIENVVPAYQPPSS